MPLFNLSFPFDEEERKRRMLTPPNVPAPRLLPRPPSRGVPGEIPDGPMMGVSPGSSLPPEAPGPSGRMLPAPPGMPGGERATMPGLVGSPPLTRPQQRAEAEHLYMAGTPTRKRSALTGALEGFMGGGGLLGAATGAVYGAADPRGMRRRRFEREEKPRLMEQWQLEDMDRARARQAEKDALDEEYRRAQTGALNRSNLPQPPKQLLPDWKQTDQGWIDLNAPENRGKTFKPYTPPKETKPPNALEATIDPESGLSAEEMARKSYEARGGDKYVLSKLPERTRRILQEGLVTSRGKTRSATTAERDSAQREFERAIERQLNADKDYTRGNIRAKRVGGSRPQVGNTGIARPRSQFNSKKFPGLKFD